MITFDIEQSPPPTEQIMATRQHYAAILQANMKRERLYKFIFYMASLFVLFVVFACAFAPKGTLAEALEYMYAVTITLVVWYAIVITCLIQVERRIPAQRNTANKFMAGLVDLEYSGSWNECIQFDAWRDQDEMIKTYSNALAIMKRKPVVAEYDAARSSIETRSHRIMHEEQVKKARAACERMAQAV